MLKVQVLSLRPKGKILDSYVKDFFCTKKSGLEPVRHEALRKCKAFLAECAETKVEAVVCEQSEADVKSFHSDQLGASCLSRAFKARSALRVRPVSPCAPLAFGTCVFCGKHRCLSRAFKARSALRARPVSPYAPLAFGTCVFCGKHRCLSRAFKARSALRARPVSPYAPLASRRG